MEIKTALNRAKIRHFRPIKSAVVMSVPEPRYELHSWLHIAQH